MSFTLPELPYHKESFGKVISVETFDYHYGKHHQTYITNLNNLVKGTQWEHTSLDDIVTKYILTYSAVRTLRYSIMLPSIGTILSIGTALLLTRLSFQDSSRI